jgi:hypothetical protein
MQLIFNSRRIAQTKDQSKIRNPKSKIVYGSFADNPKPFCSDRKCRAGSDCACAGDNLRDSPVDGKTSQRSNAR